VVVFGTYGFDEASAWSGRQTAHAAQAFAIVEPTDRKNPGGARTAAMKPALLDGLPRTQKGWVEGDLEIGGQLPSGVWLERTMRTPAATNKGALFETAHDGFTWAGSSWRASSGRDGFLRGGHATLATAALLCPDTEGAALSLLASERAADGTTFVAGRCEDELHRPVGPIRLGRYDVRARAWQRIAAPASALFEGNDAIVNAGILAVSANEAWIWAYRPFSERERDGAYLVHLDRGDATLVEVPFARAIVSLARVADGSLYAITGFAELRRMNATGSWDDAAVALPQLGFVEPTPAPGDVRLLDVQAVQGTLWVHGAIPTVREDGSPGREHLLYTTAPWAAPLHCDRERAPEIALTPGTFRVRLAVMQEQAAR
jgi:hypothetical protein